MSRIKTKAEYLLEELRLIPKMIKQLKLDVEATRSSLLTSPQWSDMKVSGGVRRTQTDKNVSIIDASDYGLAEIDRLIKRREKIIGIIMRIPDVAQRHVLLTTYLRCETFDEAIDMLELNRNKYYTIKTKAVKNLNIILNRDKIIRN
ncbi:hypothetical protein Si021_00972 [Streptococcus infantarius subsp. infantarius]|uniref:DUF1492 domain-containing protein n=1 Tax=Streptococcus infantarius TaxID=102684 RepID=UPI00208F0804|nr:hypothetical protein [Streptococcus infantarius subsp. infantarius]MCO4648837.1 hypothetical protein [Streptococcus infantarius subsp. infantarius]MCO4653113.1 hypothetical protein [Streptococcus infantarius subsp. infantarius]MCO4655246.1 hypothetical protein [Streptococcus infantarius subsp. infantarius]MCO4661217.1 hypothetical protein [Streptococcus infantarius subsp. infantarius]